jgi:hypothetical protein
MAAEDNPAQPSPTSTEPSHEPSWAQPQPVVSQSAPNHKKAILIATLCVVVLALVVGAFWLLGKQSATPKQSASTTKTTTTTSTQTTPPVSGLQLGTKKNYGNKYANGLLPVGDSKYATDAAKKGYIYMCNAKFVPAGQAGAQTRGPWFVNNNTQWDMNKKAAIAGNVTWQQSITMQMADGKRVITTNDLPDHHTGTFPVAANDPARVYDANPNTISSQSLTYSLAASPASGSPQCMGGEVGVMLTGVALFNGFDAGGRDAGAWEVQDSCDGHPQNKGEYHYHTPSRCITDVSVSKVIGFALDGFPITGPKVGENNILTTDDLDECHGIVSQITLDNKKVTSYHYVMTQDFPYSASCFRATAIQPPGQHETAGRP